MRCSFGARGKAFTDFSGSGAIGFALALQWDGKIVVVGTSSSDIAVARCNPDGTLDSSFGDGGTVRTDFSDVYESFDQANAVTIQGNGKIVVAGWTVDDNCCASSNFALVRYSVAFSPDGRILASGSDDWTVILWNVATGRRVWRTLRGNAGFVNSVEFSPNGDILATGNDGGVILWDLAVLRQLEQPPKGFTGPVHSLAFSPDSKTLASTSGNAIIGWDPTTGRQFGHILSDSGSVWSRPTTRFQVSPILVKDRRVNSACVGIEQRVQHRREQPAMKLPAPRPSIAALVAVSLTAAIFAASPPRPAAASADGIDTPGVVRSGSGGYEWWLSNDFNANVAYSFTFGSCCDTPLVGDWNGDGIDTPGVNVGGNYWVLNDGYDGQAEYQFYYGNPGDKPIVGDWDGDGRDTMGVVRDGTWYFRNNLTGGAVDFSVGFGNPSDVPLPGDWNGDGIDTPGVKRDQWWYLSNDFNSNVAYALVYGNPGDQGLIGDWNADGIDTPGVKRNQWWYLSNDFHANVAFALVYGNDQGDIGVVGDWDSSPPSPDEQVDEVLESYTDPGTAQARAARAAAADSLPVWAKYAPVVYIHPSEPYLPASVRYFLDAAELKFSNDNRGDDTVLNNTELQGPNGTRRNWRRLGFLNPISSVNVNSQKRFWTDEHTRPYDDGRDPTLRANEGFFLDLLGTDHRSGVGTTAPVYYEWSPEACSSQGCAPGYITYWFFYAYDIGANAPVSGFNHEADWERISIHLNSNQVPTQVAYYRHTCYRTLDWPTQVQKEGTHPVVYSAYGSHGSYATPNGTDNCPGVPGDDEVHAGGARWATWLRMGDVARQPWYGYGGAWGEVGYSGITTGPLGPSPWKAPHPPEWGLA